MLFLSCFLFLCYIPRWDPRLLSSLRKTCPKITMQSMQRKFGRITSKRSADDSQVAVLLKDFEDADSLLTKVGGLFSGTRVLY